MLDLESVRKYTFRPQLEKTLRIQKLVNLIKATVRVLFDSQNLQFVVSSKMVKQRGVVGETLCIL